MSIVIPGISVIVSVLSKPIMLLTGFTSIIQYQRKKQCKDVKI